MTETVTITFPRTPMGRLSEQFWQEEYNASEPLEHVSATTPLPHPENGLRADLEALERVFARECSDEFLFDDWEKGYHAAATHLWRELKKILDKHVGV